MIRFIIRLLALSCLAIAFGLLVVDGTRSIAGGSLSLNPLGQLAFDFFPLKMAQLQPAIEKNIHPLLWDPLVLNLLLLPGWFVIGGAGALLFYAARRPAPEIGFSSRP